MKGFVRAVIECLRGISRLVGSIRVAIDGDEILVVQVKRIAVRMSRAKPFGIDRGMNIHDTLQSLRFGRDAAASNFLAVEIAAFTTQWCYAKITPAALHRSSFAKRGNENGEAVGCRL